MKNLNLFLCIVCIGSMALSGCGNVRTKNDEEIITKRERQYKGYGKFFGEDALLFGGHDKLQKKPDVGLGVNKFLWRATLDTLSFMPLQTVDPFGGVIVTDWYTDPNARSLKGKKHEERVRVNVRILDRMLRADGLSITVFRQVFKNGRWVTAPVAKGTAEKLENAILKKARQFKSSGQY